MPFCAMSMQAGNDRVHFGSHNCADIIDLTQDDDDDIIDLTLDMLNLYLKFPSIPVYNICSKVARGTQT